MSFAIRTATAADADTICGFIEELARYERAPAGAVSATPERLREQLGQSPPPFECLLAEEAGRALGFALYFQNYSTWRALPGLYLEDLFVTPAARGRGVVFRLTGDALAALGDEA